MPGSLVEKVPPKRKRAFQSEMNQIRWWHRIDLGDGAMTPGVSNCSRMLEYMVLPDSLAGKTVLDVGASDGFFSFEAERRGAARVVAVDLPSWGMPTGDRGFRLVHRLLRSRVKQVKMSVYDFNSSNIGQFDVVLFLGVLYHLKHPLLALEKLALVTKGLLIMETQLDMQLTNRPVMAFYPTAELGGDPSNWWAPNDFALKEMLGVAGFSQIRCVHMNNPAAKKTRGIFHALRSQA